MLWKRETPSPEASRPCLAGLMAGGNQSIGPQVCGRHCRAKALISPWCSPRPGGREERLGPLALELSKHERSGADRGLTRNQGSVATLNSQHSHMLGALESRKEG
jgi:hypothetical protein